MIVAGVSGTCDESNRLGDAQNRRFYCVPLAGILQESAFTKNLPRNDFEDYAFAAHLLGKIRLFNECSTFLTAKLSWSHSRERAEGSIEL